MGKNNTDFSGAKNPNYRHGFGRVKNRPSFYNSWQNMKARCLRPSHPKYHRYGGRGIDICSEWLTIEGFSSWALNNGWREGLTIDRIDNNRNYEPKNCRWVSLSANSRKKSTTKITLQDAENIRKRALKGECEYELAKEYGVVHGTVWFIVNNFTHMPDIHHSKKKSQPPCAY